MQTQAQWTLLALVHALNAFIDNDREVVATVTSLVTSGRVRLCGTFAGATLDPSPPSPPEHDPHTCFFHKEEQP